MGCCSWKSKRNEFLTMDEIKKRFDEEWVLLQEPTQDRQGRVTRYLSNTLHFFFALSGEN